MDGTLSLSALNMYCDHRTANHERIRGGGEKHDLKNPEQEGNEMSYIYEICLNSV